MQEVAVARYHTFINVADTLGQLQEETTHMQEHCSSLQSSLPSLSAAADAFAQRASDLAAQRAANKQLLSAPPLHCLPGLFNCCDPYHTPTHVRSASVFWGSFKLAHSRCQISG